jgi:hypothetical protein
MNADLALAFATILEDKAPYLAIPESELPKEPLTFTEAVKRAINSYSMENGSDTPDFLLADYLTDCLLAYNRVTKKREKYYGREPKVVPTDQCPQTATS